MGCTCQLSNMHLQTKQLPGMGCTCRLNSMHALATQTACCKTNSHVKEPALPLQLERVGCTARTTRTACTRPSLPVKCHVDKMFNFAVLGQQPDLDVAGGRG